jgi:hypothetical protein
MPESVTKVQYGAFCNCPGITEISLPNCAVIGDQAFQNCTALVSVTIGSAKTENVHIYPKAFQDCTALESVQILSDTVEFGDSAFWGCKKLYNVVLPKKASGNMMYNTFNRCPRLQSVTVPEGITELYGTFYECRSLENVTLPDGLTTIQGEVFSGCTSLESIEIPSSVTFIGSGSFSECPLKDVKFYSEKGNLFTEQTLKSTFGRNYFTENFYGRCYHCGGKLNLFGKCKSCGKRDYDR